MALFIITFCFFPFDEFLYMKSGAVYKCDSYRIEGNSVIPLPESGYIISTKAVDWKKTAQAREERQARADWRHSVKERLQKLNLAFEGNIADLADEIRGLKAEEIFSLAADVNQNKRVALFGLAGDFGYDEAWYSLGATFLKGERPDYELAADWIEKAAVAGIARAQYALGLMFQEGRGRQKDQDQALTWLRKAAEAGNEDAGKLLGRIFSTSPLDLSGDADGLFWLETIAREGNRDAQLRLGKMYRRGLEVTADYALAEELLTKAANRDSREARHELGLLYFENQTDYQQARKWLELAAADQVTDAQVKLAYMHQEGLGVPQDRKKALAWLRDAAELGNTEAQFMVGAYFDQGLDMRPDPEEAVRWYRQAAEKNYAPAQTNLGLAYETGEGVEQNYQEALRWYHLAAAQNYPKAIIYLAISYRKGVGVEKDPEMALSWYRKAAALGHEEAQAAIQSYELWSTGQLDAHKDKLEAQYLKVKEKFGKELVTYAVMAPDSEAPATADVSYTNGKGVTTYLENVSLPWSKNLMADKGDSLRVSATSKQVGVGVMVNITVNKVVKAKESSAERVASATAVYRIKRRYEPGTPQDL